LEARDYLAAGNSVTKLSYLGLMDMIRMAIKRYENKKCGCPTGFHAGTCTCSPARLGHCLPYAGAVRKNDLVE
jgi:hypothetical protein